MTATIIPTPMPIIIPVSGDDESKKCPKCHKHEELKTVCAHCGYEYEDESEPSSLKDNIIFVLLLIAIVGIPIWLFVTFLQFVVSYSHPTLMEVIYNQWLWVSDIFSRLW